MYKPSVVLLLVAGISLSLQRINPAGPGITGGDVLEHTVGQPPLQDTNITIRLLNFNWSPDGKEIVFTGMKWDKRVKGVAASAIFAMDFKSRQIEKLTDNASNPSVSPDGKRIAYTKPSGSSSDIFIWDRYEKKSTRLVADTTREFWPCWSPDGKYIAYCAENNKVIDIHIADVETGKTRPITASGKHRSYSPAWSPDGKYIVYYFETGDNRDQIYLTDPLGSFHKNLTHDTSTHNFYPSWYSSNEILYTRNSTGIARIKPDGTGLSPVEGIRTYMARQHPKSEDLLAYIGIAPEKNLVLYNRKTGTKEVLIDEKIMNGLL